MTALLVDRHKRGRLRHRGRQVTEQEAMERLITQAAQEVDYAWFKKIGETDGQAQSFLRKAPR